MSRSRVIYADGRIRPSPPAARTQKEAMAAWRRAFKELKRRVPRRVPRREAQRPPVVHDRPSSTPRLREGAARVVVVASGRDGQERDDGSGSSDGDGGGSGDGDGSEGRSGARLDVAGRASP